MLVAVTGATGFVGRYLVRHLARAGHRLRCWYRPGGDRGGFEDIAGAVAWLPGELGNDDATARPVAGRSPSETGAPPRGSAHSS